MSNTSEANHILTNWNISGANLISHAWGVLFTDRQISHTETELITIPGEYGNNYSMCVSSCNKLRDQAKKFK